MVALQSMFEAGVLNADTVYWSVKVLSEWVLIGFSLDVVPSHVVASVGRLAIVPPGSEHSRISTPVGSCAGVGNPVPDTVIV